MTQQEQDFGDDFDFTQEKQNKPEIGDAELKVTGPEKKEEPSTKKKVFTRSNVVRAIPIDVVFPKIYPDHEPFGFKFRLRLSKEAEEQREQYYAMSPAQQTETYAEQSLNEVCDLLTELPTGFGDLQDTGQGPGHSFRSYIETATDPDIKHFFELLVIGARNAYWNAVAAHEFRN